MKFHSFSGRAAAAIVLCLLAPGLLAATFDVASGDVVGLKSSMVEANGNSEDDTINLALNGTYLLTSVDTSAGSDGLSGLPQIGRPGFAANSHSLVINGNGATIVRSTSAGTPEFRILRITYSSDAGKNCTIANVTIANGRLSGDFAAGGGIRAEGDVVLNNCTIRDNAADFGGGIYNRDPSSRPGRFTLTLNACNVLDNTAKFEGGGISSSETNLKLNRCLLSGNNTPGGEGGALHNRTHAGDSIVSATNCTFSANSAFGGGGILNTYEFANPQGRAQVLLVNCTFQASNIFNTPPSGTVTVTVELANILLAGSSLGFPSNVGGNGGFISYGYNLSDSFSRVLIGPGDRVSTDPKLDPAGLAFNGGPTRTIALTGGSPALDRGHPFGFGVLGDQRGFIRPVDLPAYPNASGGDGRDIGAFEAGPDPIQRGTPSFVVTTTDDHDDGVCGENDCTLREAVQRANTLQGPNTITFAPGVTGTITLLQAAGGGLIITDNTTIAGPGARVLAISSNTQSRLFFVTAGASISGLTLRDGFVAGGAPGTTNSGGGIFNQATLTLTDCSVVHNRVLGANAAAGSGGDGGGGRGGAIYNVGSLNVRSCSFGGNGASGGSGDDAPGLLGTGGKGGGGSGGAIFNDTGGVLVIERSTFFGNDASGGGGGTGNVGGSGGMGAGAVFNQGVVMALFFSTFSGNFGGGGAGGQGRFQDGSPGKGVGGIRAEAGTSRLARVLIAGNLGSNSGGPDTDGTFISGGYNLIGIGDFSTGFTAIGDQIGTSAAPIDPKLGPLQDNGGGTDSMALLLSSPALDQGENFGGTVTTDQRGVKRPIDLSSRANAPEGDGADIGAFELAGVVFIVTTTEDHDDGSSDGNDCTLREAIKASNALGGGIIALPLSLTGAIQLGSELPPVSGDLDLQGPGANLLTVRRNTGGDYRIFTITNGTTHGPIVKISGLTIANGFANGSGLPGTTGGGILNDHGHLTLAGCTLSGNVCAPFGRGGAICNYGRSGGSATLVVNNSTFSGNTSGGTGGGIYNDGGVAGHATLALSNSTLSFNAADMAGGGIINAGDSGGNAILTVINCTFSGNTSGQGGGILNDDSSSGFARVTLANTLLHAGALGANLTGDTGTITSQGDNLSSDGAGGLRGTAPGGFLNGLGDIRNINLSIASLADNGGPTPTHALLPNSPAINAGNNANAPLVDQRGYLRSGASDIGAFEFEGAAPSLEILSMTPAGQGPIVLRVLGVPNGVHRIQVSGDLSPASFVDTATATGDATGFFRYEDTASPGRRFYRAIYP